jgi:LytR cell envelope-related transcriptional attenuator
MGRHIPPTSRSYYLSVAASTLRFAIIVALAVGGVLLINQAFPEAQGGGTSAIPNDGPAVSESPSPSPSESPAADPTPSPTVTGTRIAVFNGAGVSGLAGDTQTALVEQYSYVAAQDPADAPATVDVTTIYYRSADDKVEAEFLANDFFGELPDVRVARLQAGSDVDRRVQVAIYLGNDYADLVA